MLNFLFLFAADSTDTCATPSGNSVFSNGLNLPHTCAGHSELQTALQIFAGILGAIALLIITINALRYIISQGDSAQTAKAKNGILYALVGLVLCISAYSIVTFVLFNVT